MKIGVISDTHLPYPSESLCKLTSNVFADVQMILHAGDLTNILVLDAFAEKEVFAVCGNMDDYDISATLPDKRVIRIGNFRIGLIHGWGSRNGIEERIIKSFENVHAIVYGHSHRPANHIKNGILMFNPGSFSGSYSSAGISGSVGILTVGDKISGEIIQI
ncbi:MAG: YfcE family phosphodiesterase [Desulfobacterales bacterium]|nr:YfcE family phosphodiesterase [Desulfobacterales bacterium]